MLSSVRLFAVLLLTLVSVSAGQFNFSLFPNPFGSVECTIALLLAPIGPVGSQTGTSGDIIVFGGSYDGKSAVQPVSDTNTSIAAIAIGNFDGIPPGGQPGCAARSGTTNLLYTIGVNASVSSSASFNELQYYVYRSTDAYTWTNVLDNATQALFLNRPDDDLTRCGVDLAGDVYDIGSATTYKSTNQGVTWAPVTLTGSRFANRTSFAGGIYTSVSTNVDTLIVIGGRQAPTPGSIYGGTDFNDVWTSTNGGASWTQATASAPWSQRDSLSWAYSGGVHIIYGGTQEGGFGLYYADLWASVDDGATWQLLANSTAAGEFSNTAIIFDAAGYLYLFGGETSSTGSNGYTWSSVEGRSTVPVGSVAQLVALIGGPSSSSSTAGTVVASSAPSTTSVVSSSAAVTVSSSTAPPTGNGASITAVAVSLPAIVLAVCCALALGI